MEVSEEGLAAVRGGTGMGGRGRGNQPVGSRP
jgi:hypothetical protein